MTSSSPADIRTIDPQISLNSRVRYSQNWRQWFPYEPVPSLLLHLHISLHIFRKFRKGKLLSISYSSEVYCSLRQQVSVTLSYLSTKLCGVTSQRPVNLVCHLHNKPGCHLLILTPSIGLLILLTVVDSSVEQNCLGAVCYPRSLFLFLFSW